MARMPKRAEAFRPRPAPTVSIQLGDRWFLLRREPSSGRWQYSAALREALRAATPHEVAAFNQEREVWTAQGEIYRLRAYEENHNKSLPGRRYGAQKTNARKKTNYERRDDEMLALFEEVTGGPGRDVGRHESHPAYQAVARQAGVGIKRAYVIIANAKARRCAKARPR